MVKTFSVTRMPAALRLGFLAVLAGFLFLPSGRLNAQTPYIGEVRLFAGNFAPLGWSFCDGSLLPISENEALYNLIGTTYGGDGVNTFALPDLRSRVPISQGQGPGLSSYVIGQTGGVETVMLTTSQLPSHSHSILANAGPGSSSGAIGDFFALYPGQIAAYAADGRYIFPTGSVGAAGNSQPHDNIQPYLAVNYIIALEGVYPSTTSSQDKGKTVAEASDPYLGEILLVSFGFAPHGWTACNGQLLAINQNTALFSLLGTTYGGNGTTNFALPDLRGRVPLHAGTSSIALGQAGGEEAHTLTVPEMPAHTHSFPASSSVGTTADPRTSIPARNGEDSHVYGKTQNAAMNGLMLSVTGGNFPHENRQPYLAMQYVIALEGIFPSRP